MRAAALQVGRWKSATALKSDARTCYYRRIGRHSRLRWTSASGLPSVSRRHAAAASEGWSGRRGSNPRPTAWKAVTLPLSYSRALSPFVPVLLRPIAPSRHHVASRRLLLRRRALARLALTNRRQRVSVVGQEILGGGFPLLTNFQTAPTSLRAEGKLVGRGGFEPP